MNTGFSTQTIGELVRDNPARSRVFEDLSIDYCCGGKVTLETACRARGLDPEQVAQELIRLDQRSPRTGHDASTMAPGELAEHIVATHHAYLRRELPRIDFLTEKVARVHGDAEPRLHEVRAVFTACRNELEDHMLKEERVLFPMIRELERAGDSGSLHGGSIADPIRMMEHEHENAGDALDRLRELTDGYSPAPWACNTYRAMLEALAAFERDMHEHVHKENHILFPRAIELERAKRR